MPVEDDKWTAHYVSDFTFFTGNGVTLLSHYQEDAEKARQRWRSALKEKPDLVRWQWERFENHEHQTMSLPERELVFKEWCYLRKLSHALTQAFPERCFIVSWIPAYAVSFYDYEEDVPECGVEVLQEPGEAVFCVTCQARRSFSLTANPDPDVPELCWVRCSVCETDCLIGQYEVRFLVGPTRA